MWIKGHKTWFNRDSQKWVNNIPRAFWLNIYDCYTGEKLYSDDTIYFKFRGVWRVCFPGMINPTKYAEKYNRLPCFSGPKYYLYTKTPYNSKEYERFSVKHRAM